jgi:molecular chaperone GrpE
MNKVEQNNQELRGDEIPSMNQEEQKNQELLDDEICTSNQVEEDNKDVQEEEVLQNNKSEVVSDSQGNNLDIPADEDPLKVAQEKYLRLYADFDNFRKRTQKEKADLINYAAGDVIKDFLEVFDDFQRALEANKSNEDLNSLKEGFELLFHKFDLLLKNKGLQEIECIGQDFNPDFHEAITNVPSGEDMKGKVVDVIQKGYKLKDRVIRYAKVVVGQ